LLLPHVERGLTNTQLRANVFRLLRDFLLLSAAIICSSVCPFARLLGALNVRFTRFHLCIRDDRIRRQFRLCLCAARSSCCSTSRSSCRNTLDVRTSFCLPLKPPSPVSRAPRIGCGPDRQRSSVRNAEQNGPDQPTLRPAWVAGADAGEWLLGISALKCLGGQHSRIPTHWYREENANSS
jgi:hypothetical protein